MPKNYFIWRGQSLLICRSEGEITRGISGYYFRGARHLSKLQFLINGQKLRLCSLSKPDFSTMEFFYIYPPVQKAGTGGSGSGMIDKVEGISVLGLDINANYTVMPGSLSIKLSIANRWDSSVHFELQLEHGADYTSFDDAESNVQKVKAPVRVSQTPHKLEYFFDHAQLPFRTRIVLPEQSLWRHEGSRVSRIMEIDRGNTADLTFTFIPIDPQLSTGHQDWVQRLQKVESLKRGMCRISSASPQGYASIVNRSMEYISSAALLDGEPDECLTPAGGFPRYPFLFGRDTITSGWMMAMFDGGVSIEHSLNRLGRLQGKGFDTFRDEQPGRIIQQARHDPSSRLGEDPFSLYYGDYASPFMFIISLAHHYAWTGNKKVINRHYDHCRTILNWAENHGDIDGDGFLEYKTQSPDGPRNQGWKDSENAVVNSDGFLVEPPIATCEVQGYYYAALQAMALFAFIKKSFKDASRYFKKSIELKRRFNREFWVESGRYIAFGLDSKKEKILTRASNMGHCLAAGIIDKSRIGHVVDALFDGDMFSGWGVRTVSSANPSYNPLSYHLGSVWPVENATIAFGLRRYGFDSHAQKLLEVNYELGLLWGGFVPECVGGYPRESTLHPGAHPRSNPFQTWNAAAFALFTHVMLGLQPAAPVKTLFIDPQLPAWLPDLTVENLRVGEANVTMHFRRCRNGRTRTTVLKKQGTLFILHQPPVNSMHTPWWKRLAALK